MHLRYAISIPWHNRQSYLRITLATLREAYRGRWAIDKPKVVLFNHKSTEEVPAIALEECADVVALNSFNCHHVYIDMVRHMFSRYDVDYVLNIDADSIVHPGLLGAVEQMMADLPDLGHGSFFNETFHPEPIEVVKEIYHRRKHISFLGSLLRREAWNKFKPPEPGEQFRFGCVDGMLSTFISEETPYGVFSTRRSYVDHIGYGGAHAGESDGVCTSSRGRRFYP